MKTHSIIFFIFIFKIGICQDIHFSQFWEPLSITNPSLIGNFDGDIKLHAQYRNQWSQFNSPLVTYYVDATYKLNKKTSYWAFGISVMKDQMNFLTYNQNRILGSVSYQKNLSSKVQGGIGMQGGTRMTSVDPNRLTYNRQWDSATGQFNPIIASLENFPSDNFMTPFVNIGSSINIHNPKLLHTFDISAMYIGQNQSNAQDFVFYQPFKINANYHAYWKIKKNITLMPKIGGIYTAKANSLNSGLLCKLSYKDKKEVYFGTMFRWGVDRNGDAIIPVAGARLNNIKIGVSYDWTTSGLKQEGLKNAYELSISYIFKFSKNTYYSIDCLRL